MSKRQVSFTFPTPLVESIQTWFQSVTEFYQKTLGPLDPTTLATFQEDVYGQTELEEVETVAVHFCVQLTSLLGNVELKIRVGAATLLYQLACIIQPVDSSLDTLLLGFETDEQGFRAPVDSLFIAIGKSLSLLAIAYVSGLENFLNKDWRVRGICTAALARVVFENDLIFIQEDKLSAVWNLYFSLDSIPMTTQVFPDRIVVLEGLGLLAPLYSNEENLALGVAERLMRLPEKTPAEIEAIQNALSIIIQSLCKNQLAYDFILSLITPNDEDAYDLLAWAFEACTLRLSAVPGSASLKNFILALSNHFRASPSLVRYGAAICLHSTIKLFPTFPIEQPHVIYYLVSGAMDMDHLTRYLYIDMLSMIECDNAADISSLLSSWKSDNQSVNFTDILDLVAKHGPPLSNMILHKMANSLEFLPLNSKRINLKLLSVWAKRSGSLDVYLMQQVLPLCSDHSIQADALDVIHTILPSFMTASGEDVQFAWRHLSKLLNSKSWAVLTKALEMFKYFPVQTLNADSKDDFIMKLFSLVFHNDNGIRAQVYELLGVHTESFRSGSSLDNAASVILLSLGDEVNLPILTKVLSQMVPILSKSVEFKGLTNPLPQLVYHYHAFASLVFNKRSDLKSLVDYFTEYRKTDEFFTFFNKGVAEFQLAKPDDYTYSRCLIHNPFWVSLLLVRFSVPPPVPAGENGKREVCPVTPAGKRRFHFGFLSCLLPTLGVPDPFLRHSGCLSLVLGAFKGNLDANIVKGIFEMLQQQLLTHKNWAYHVSAFDLLTSMTRLKLPGYSSAIFQQYFEMSLDFMANTGADPVKIAILDLYETFLLVFPNSIQEKLEHIRDAVRPLLVETNPSLSQKAYSVYPLIFKTVLKTYHHSFETYLKEEMSALKNGSEDPFIAKLSPTVRSSLFDLLIHCSGLLVPAEVYQHALGLLKWVTQGTKSRLCAINGVLNLIPYMDASQKSCFQWILLPLYGDQPIIRSVIHRFIKGKPTVFQEKCQLLTPHPQDATGLPILSWEYVNESAHYDPSSALMLTQTFDQLLPRMEWIQDQPPLDFYKEYANSIESLSQAVQTQVLYYLGDFQKSTSLKPFVNIVLSEFTCIYQEKISQVGPVLVDSLVEPSESDLHGLYNLAERPGALKQIIDTMSNTEGELYSLLYLKPLIQEHAISKAPEILNNVLPLVNSRQPFKRKLFAALVSADMALLSSKEDSRQVLDQLQILLPVVNDVKSKQQLLGSVSRLLERVPDHGIIDHLRANCSKCSKSLDVNERMHAVSMFKVFYKYISQDQAQNYLMLFLADPDKMIVDAIKMFLACNWILDESHLPLLETKAERSEYVEQEPQGIFQGIDKRLLNEGPVQYGWLLSVNPIDILSTLDQDLVKEMIETSMAALSVDNPSEETLFQIEIVGKLLTCHGDTGLMKRFSQLLNETLSTAQLLRSNLYSDLEKSFYFYNDYADIPIINDEQYHSLEALKEQRALSSLEIAKSGKLDHYTSYMAKKNEENQAIDDKTESLSSLTTMALSFLKCLGPFYAQREQTAGFRYLMQILEDEHKGLRGSALEAMEYILQNNDEFKENISGINQELLVRLADPNLFSRKVEFIRLISKSISNDQIDTFLSTLVKFWKDPDGNVRQEAIRAMQYLGEHGFPIKTPMVMEKIAGLMHHEDYPEKEDLQRLLSWWFTE